MPEKQIYPKCPKCNKPLAHIRYLDYGEIRVVYHAECDNVIGVVNAREES